MSDSILGQEIIYKEITTRSQSNERGRYVNKKNDALNSSRSIQY